jgi:YVTN family beta-propeller protein
MKYLIQLLSSAVRRVFAFAVSATGCLGTSAGLALLAGFSAAAMAQQPVEAPHSGLINSAGAAFNAATGKSYVVNSDGNSVEVSKDRADVARSVKAGSHPVSVAVDSQNGRAYVVNAGDGTVSVLDGETDEVVATVQVGDHPYSIASVRLRAGST